MGTLGIIRDVTERYELQEQLLHAQKMDAAGRLAGGIAHDFNNTLAVILCEAALARRVASRDHALEALRRIAEAAQRASSLTRQLLTFSRRHFTSPALFVLDDLIGEALPMLRHLVNEEIEVRVHCGAAAAAVRADRGLIEQVLANLIVNARDAMPDGGVLTIETRTEHLSPSPEWRIGSVQPGEHVVLTVSDTGTGMCEDVRCRLFEPFFTTKASGTGLGLATCHGILTQSGGDIAVDSSVGGGARISVCLPRQHAPVEPAGAACPGQLLGTERILLVEDDRRVREVTAAMLRELGYRVVETENGQEALAHLEAHAAEIDLVLSDVIMPRMGGSELVGRLRAEHPEMKILLMTGYTDDDSLRRRVEQEGLPIVEKPFTELGLASALRAVLERE